MWSQWRRDGSTLFWEEGCRNQLANRSLTVLYQWVRSVISDRIRFTHVQSLKKYKVSVAKICGMLLATTKKSSGKTSCQRSSTTEGKALNSPQSSARLLRFPCTTIAVMSACGASRKAATPKNKDYIATREEEWRRMRVSPRMV